MTTPLPEWLQTFDEDAFLKLHQLLHHLRLQDAMRFSNELGNGYVLVPILFAVTLLTRRWRLGAVLALQVGLAVGIAGLATDNLKDAFPRDRPYRALNESFTAGRATLEFDDAHAGRSFPSGHAGTAFAWAMVLYIWARGLGPRWKRVVARGMLVVLPVCVGLARVFAGAHFPVDVVAGAAVGLAAALLVVAICSPLKKRVEAAGGGLPAGVA